MSATESGSAEESECIVQSNAECICVINEEFSNFTQSAKRSTTKFPFISAVLCFSQIFAFLLLNHKQYAIFVFDPDLKNEIWRYFSYTFLHSNQVHLLVNISMEVITAIPLEYEQGHVRVLTVFLTGGIAGCLGTLVVERTYLLVGASAGIYSLLMSHVPHLIINFDHLRYRHLRIVSVIILSFSDIAFTIYHCLRNKNEQPTISLGAHCCGALNGLLLGFVIFRSYTKTNLFYVKIVVFAFYSIVLYLLLVTLFKRVDRV